MEEMGSGAPEGAGDAVTGAQEDMSTTSIGQDVIQMEDYTETAFSAETSIFDDMSDSAALEFVNMVTSAVLEAIPTEETETFGESVEENPAEVEELECKEDVVLETCVEVKDAECEEVVDAKELGTLPGTTADKILDESDSPVALEAENQSTGVDCEDAAEQDLHIVDEVVEMDTNISPVTTNGSSPDIEIIELDEPIVGNSEMARNKGSTPRNKVWEAEHNPSLMTHTRRPRRVIFDTNIPPNKYEGAKHGLKLPKFPGMGTHEIVQRMADRGHILYIDGSLRWVGPTSAEKRTWMSMISEDGDEFDDDEDDMSIGGPLDIYSPMTVTPVNTPKWRYRKKNQLKIGGQVDPSSIVPNSVSSSLGSTGSASETELGTDEDEDDAELASQGWIVTKAEGSDSPLASPAPAQEVEYELIEEPEFVMEEPPVIEGPPQKKRKQKHEPQPHTDGKIYPKPGFSYSCLIAMSLKNSKLGSLPVSEIYKFMCDHFPYFKSAPSGWKNSVRHNLSLNKCFEKIEKPGNAARKGCLWGLCAGKMHKMDEEVQKWLKKDPGSVIRAMSDPENLELIERGELKRDYSGNNAGASDDEEDDEESVTPVRTVLPNARNTKVRQATAVTTTVVGGETIITTTPVTMSQIRASLQQQQQIRVIKQEDQLIVPDDTKQTIDLAQLGSVQGNYLCHPNGTFTLSFTGLTNQSTTPLIIRRTPVK